MLDDTLFTTREWTSHRVEERLEPEILARKKVPLLEEPVVVALVQAQEFPRLWRQRGAREEGGIGLEHGQPNIVALERSDPPLEEGQVPFALEVHGVDARCQHNAEGRKDATVGLFLIDCFLLSGCFHHHSQSAE